MPENVDLEQLDRDIEYFEKKVRASAHSGPTAAASAQATVTALKHTRSILTTKGSQ